MRGERRERGGEGERRGEREVRRREGGRGEGKGEGMGERERGETAVHACGLQTHLTIAFLPPLPGVHEMPQAIIVLDGLSGILSFPRLSQVLCVFLSESTPPPSSPLPLTSN